ncbi:hypothetical protein [Neorhodopirellula pilleata]|uniref:Uncharacterized protein n=1 Tax=Neorhodopirellula pilleata TaxID=2714738 RepID=A0A5C5ZXC3_9BACT|nr:hypothetical protein [Neorhodopirellula pilleata]TWT91899.1 hypothetical protein Pla100_49390 [Neorhodopirellula pilleata]
MTQRERFLSIIIGGLVFVVAAQWIFNQYRGALRFRQNRLNSLAGEAETMQMTWLAGAEAERQMGEYKIRSLSSDPQIAQSSFQSWLLETVREVGLQDAIVDPVGDIPVGDLYRRYGFRLSGKTDLPGLLDLVYEVQARDQLHRIRDLNFAPVTKAARRGVSEEETEDTLSVVMVIDAISLSIAETNPPTPTDQPSWRIAQSKEDYRNSILNRNFFKPPNQAPRYRGSEQLVATIGQSNELKFEFEDPEKHDIRLTIDGDLPPWAMWDESRGRLIVSPPKPTEGESVDGEESPTPSAELAPIEVQVTAIDNGYPSRQTTQTVLVKTQEPPPPPKPTPPSPGFDDSTQTFLTALVHGRDDWTAWMSVRTRGQTLKLKVGDEFEIGTVRGKVTGVTSRSVMIEIDGQSYELKPADKLSDAIKS